MKRAAALALILLVTTSAHAQNPFVLVGPGADVSQGSARVAGRGGWGMAESDTLSPSFVNPASLADLHHFAVMFGGFGETSRSDGYGAERRSNRAFLPEIRVALPLRDGRLALQSGFSVRRSAQYRTEVATSWEWIDLDDSLTVINGYERVIREGTMFRVPLGLSWRATSWLAVGAGADWVRGPVREELAQVFADTFGSVLPNTRIEELVIDGFTPSLSLLLQPRGPFALGVAYSPAYDADLERTLSLGGVAGRLETRGTVRMPAEARAGFELDLGKAWHAGGDAKLARWSQFEGIAAWEAIVRDEWTFAAGVERRLGFAPLGRGHVTPVRAGYSWRRWAYEVHGAPVDEQTWSVGTGFPLSNRLGTIDVGLSYFRLGDEADNGWSTRGWRLALSVTGLERLVF